MLRYSGTSSASGTPKKEVISSFYLQKTQLFTSVKLQEFVVFIPYPSKKGILVL